MASLSIALLLQAVARVLADIAASCSGHAKRHVAKQLGIMEALLAVRETDDMALPLLIASPSSPVWGTAAAMSAAQQEQLAAGHDCKFCLQPGAGPDMCSPCACRGTISHVHVECLSKWVAASGSAVCPECKLRYQVDAEQWLLC